MAKEKILVVDYEEHIQELLRFNLENNGYRVICADNGLDALKIAREEMPQLILLDSMLREMDGYEVCKEIREDASIYNIPIIMLTAKVEKLDKILGLELGADEYLAKPFSIRELLAKVNDIIIRNRILYVDKTFSFKSIKIDFPIH